MTIRNTKIYLAILSFILCLFINPTLSKATTHSIGSSYTYSSPNDFYNATENGSVILNHGDTINIAFATYSGQASLAVWKKDELLIRGIGGQPHMKAAGQYIWGKGIWVAAGNNIRIENIEFSEASVPDKNGAGIRVDGNGLKVKNCYFHDNEDGILSNNSGLGHYDISYSEFAYNGYGDGYSHNIYIGHCEKFTLKYSYMHHCIVGNQIKSRADTNIVSYNRVMDEALGESSMLLDLPNGGFSIVIGNLFHQGVNAQNGRSISFGTEGTNPIMELYMTNNTMVNERYNGRVVHVNPSTTIAKLTNSILVNYSVLVEGGGSIDTSHILFTSTTNQAGINNSNYDYHLLESSSAIDMGVNPGLADTFSLTPSSEYLHPINCTPRSIVDSIDIGAYEFTPPPPNIYYVSNSGSNSNSGLSLAEAFQTLQHASDIVIAGDSVLVADGTYAGFDHRYNSGTLSSPITFKSINDNVLINQSGPLRDDGINIEEADFITLDGFICNDMTGSGNGIRLAVANNCIVRNCYCDNNAERGIFTAFTDDILIEYNVCTNSIDEHGIYVSNSSDRPIIRYNECYGNNNIGIHMNGDLSSGGDGIISNAEVYGNILHDNNLAAGINMDGVVNAEVYNNLIYNNHFAQGIALFQQDGAVPTSGIKIYNNTIVVPTDGRWGILVQPGSNVNTEIYNNIILNQHAWRGCIAVSDTSNFKSNYNVLNDKMSDNGDGSAISLVQWQALGLDTNSVLADPPTSIFEDFAANNFHLLNNAQAVDIGSSVVSPIVTDDIEGNARPNGTHFDIGAYEFQTVLAIDIERPFYGQLLNNQVILRWTVNEINNSHFYIEKSADGHIWDIIGLIPSLSIFNNYVAQPYKYIDTQNFKGISYYKLFAVDLNNKETWVGTIQINNVEMDDIIIYPNPVRDILFIRGTSYKPTSFPYRIYNSSMNVVIADTYNNTGISLNKLKNGIYFLHCYIDNKHIVKKILKL